MNSFLLFSHILLLLPLLTLGSPLSTNGRWIVDESGRRVKLACVNWASHLDAMVTEGLNKQPVDAITAKVASLGFNCVRLTYATYMTAHQDYLYLTVRQSLLKNGLKEAVDGILLHNPNIIDLPLIEAFKAVIQSLEKNNIMVIMDNHVSKPQWCCSGTDGNGFFGDEYFDPAQWEMGLSNMARFFSLSPNVIAMSLRNELRGPRQNVQDWYKYMKSGAEAIHGANPKLLVILSGLSFDNDLSFLQQKQVDLSFQRKLVYEVHWYSFTNSGIWSNGDLNEVCSQRTYKMMRKAGFLLDQGFPLFLGEFGIDQRGVNMEDNRYLPCVLSLAADLDLDWALWSLQGSYYTREGTHDMEETYSVLSFDWSQFRNVTMLRIISSIQTPLTGPGLDQVPAYKMLYHPLTGRCVLRGNTGKDVVTGRCLKSEAWIYDNGNLALHGTNSSCLQTDGEGKLAILGTDCSGIASKWDMISATKMQFSSKVQGPSRRPLCLDIGPNGRSLVTNACKCFTGNQLCDPETQWFKLVKSTRILTDEKSTIDGLMP
ncbi:hypothetical protein J5N97_007808 [Dioscorea zingiberensis]|uniref:Glycoside hydrolase family 5 domain-containing protein n=1 Tax=Dioscorea zingiberensis TaxID=325984 RepID=A0A9D5DHA0_9LILI|nr:hypothetical protein J5N97_007808 [Dioscorea zingiberensis]